MREELDLLLVYPAVDAEKYRKYFDTLQIDKGVPRQIAPHAGMAYILAVAKQHGIRAKFVNMFAEDVSPAKLLSYVETLRPRVVGFTGFTTQIAESAILARMIKSVYPDVLICVGGPHATAMPGGMLKEYDCFDFAVVGEAEDAVVQLFENDLRLGDVSNTVTRDTVRHSVLRICDLDALPFPAWDEFDLSLYPGNSPHMTRRELPMSTSRGCPGTCTFCARTFGRTRIVRSPDSIIAEIERNIRDFGCEALNFDDETFLDNATLDTSVDFFEKMIIKGLHRKVKWACEFRVDVSDLTIFKLMRRAGCYYAFFGVESANEGIRHNIGKIYPTEQIMSTISTVRDCGIVCVASFILGLPGETEETAWESIRLAKELNIYSTTFPIAVPFPGTALRRQAERGDYGLRILTNDWSLYGKQRPGVMESDMLSIERLRELQQEAYTYNPKKELPVYTEAGA